MAKSSYERHGLSFARQIGAKNIIGYVPDDLSQAKGLPDIRLPTQEFTTLHEVEAVNGLLKPLGIEDALGPLQVFPDAKAVAALKARLPVATKRIALHISAREPERRWGIDNFIALARHILEVQPGMITVLADTAVRGHDLDEAKAIAAKEAAIEAMKNRTSDMDYAAAQAELSEAVAQIQAIERLRKSTH